MTSFEERYQRLSGLQRELLDRWLAQEAGQAGAPAEPAGPGTPAERTLVQIWQEVLELPQVGVDDDYFGLGGDSIHAIVVVAKAEAAGLRLSTHDLFAARTIRRLARLAEPVPAARWPGQREAGPRHPLSPLQEGMLYHAVTAPRPVYVVQVSCRLEGDLDVTAFGRAWQAVVDRHPALRCGFGWPAGEPPWQAPAAPVGLPLEHRDWRDLPPGQPPERLAGYLAADLDRGFDLDRPPLLRLALFRTGRSTHWFVWTHHHLLLDGWSQQLVLRDVLDAYAELRAGRPAQVPARGWPADYLPARTGPGPAGDPDRFWRDYLDGFPGPVPLPASPEPAAGPRPAGDPLAVTLPEPVTAAVTGFCRTRGLSLATVLQGAWAIALARLTGASDVVFGATVSGRSAATPGITEAVGMFINTLPVRVPCRAADRLLPWLRELQLRQAEARRYEDTPLPRVARASGVPGGRSLFETILVVENFPTQLAGHHAGAGLRIAQPAARVDEGYPVVAEARPGPALALRLRYHPARCHRDAAAELLGTLAGFLADLPATAGDGDGGPSLAELGRLLDERRQREQRAERAALHAVAAARLRGSRRAPAAPEPEGGES